MYDIKILYKNHIEFVLNSVNKALDALQYEGVLLGSGKEHYYFEDDMSAPFRTNPHFAHWCPAKGANHLIKYTSGKKPVLFYYSPEDYWHIHERFHNPFWAEFFDVIQVGSLEKLWASVGNVAGHVFLGEDTKYADTIGLNVNCAFLTARLNWYRRTKTSYEIHCIKKANEKAGIAHRAAYQAFLEGGSEFEIHMNYLSALGETDADLPYPGIVGLNENSAILHYHGRKHEKNKDVLLIDSGASYLHYPADITRTYCAQKCPERFISLRDKVEQLQKELCDSVQMNAFFPDLHYKGHILVAAALHDSGILKNIHESDYERFVHEGFTKVFFPHGLGHMLGVQVHDIGGKQLDEQGNPAPKPDKQTAYKSLRYLGYLEENNVITIEPGIYFIPMLLEKLKAHKDHSKFIDWKLVEELIPYGGIRIEDNVVPTKSGAYNITREFLP